MQFKKSCSFFFFFFKQPGSGTAIINSKRFLSCYTTSAFCSVKEENNPHRQEEAMSSIRILQSLVRNRRHLCSYSPSLLSLKRRLFSAIPPSHFPSFRNHCLHPPHISFSCATLRFLKTTASGDVDSNDEEDPLQCE